MDKIEEAINYWVPIVNKEYNRQDKNAESIAFFMRLKDVATFVLEKDYYFVYLIYKNMWGEKEMSLLSFYIVPEKRATTLLHLMREFECIAKENGCKWLLIGSHLNSEFNQMLGRIGFVPSSFRKEL